MVNLLNSGAYLLNGTEVIADTEEASMILKSKLGDHVPAREEAARAEIQIVFGNSQLGLTFDIFVVDQKLLENLGTVVVMVHRKAS